MNIAGPTLYRVVKGSKYKAQKRARHFFTIILSRHLEFPPRQTRSKNRQQVAKIDYLIEAATKESAASVIEKLPGKWGWHANNRENS